MFATSRLSETDMSNAWSGLNFSTKSYKVSNIKTLLVYKARLASNQMGYLESKIKYTFTCI